MKSKIDLKKLELDVSNKRRIIDKLLQQIKVQAERAESLIANKSANWLIVAQCEKVILTFQEDSELETSLIDACESIYSAVQAAAQPSSTATSRSSCLKNLGRLPVLRASIVGFVLQAIEAFVSDDNSSKNMNNNVFHTREERQREEMEKKQEDSVFSATRGIDSNLQSAPTPADIVGEEATTKASSASSSFPGDVTRKREKEGKKEEVRNHWNGIYGRE